MVLMGNRTKDLRVIRRIGGGMCGVTISIRSHFGMPVFLRLTQRFFVTIAHGYLYGLI